MSNRETKTLTTPNGLTVEYFAYITARERLSITKALGTADTSAISIENVEASQRATIETLVVSYGGSADKIYDRIVDSRVEEFDAIFAALSEVLSPVKKTN